MPGLIATRRPYRTPRWPNAGIAAEAPAGPRRRALLRCSSALTAAGLIAVGAAGYALAAPQGGAVIEGTAEIVQTSPTTIEIRQQSDKVIIEWQSFDIGEGESVSFIQPGDFAAALNRVLSGQASAILGSLTANGQIVITNPAGISFGSQARVDVASIVASALGITNANFMAGRMVFDQPGTGVVSNAGTITAKEGGLAALVAPGVINSGTIVARLGTVALAAGNAVTLDFYGDGLVQIAVHAPVRDVPIGPDGQPLTSLIDQQGAIYADGGTVVLTAEAAEGVIDRVINVAGVLQAQTIEAHEGQIALVGGSHGEVQVAGTVDASGTDAGETGGTVHVLGDMVYLADGASIDVSGEAGGGTVLFGGDFQGGAHLRAGALGYLAPAAGGGVEIVLREDIATQGYIPLANLTYIAANTSVMADATGNGDGGKVIAWAEQATEFHGSITANGGPNGGDGGFVELSGHYVFLDGSVQIAAAAGSGGSLLVDPTNVCLALVAGTCAAGESFVDIDGFLVPLLNGASTGTSVIIISLDTVTAGHQGDINIRNAIATTTTASNVSMTMRSHDDVEQFAGSAITDSGQGLSLELIAGFDETDNADAGNNDVIINANITTNGGSFRAEADDDVLLGTGTAAIVNTGGGTATIVAGADNGSAEFAIGASSTVNTDAATDGNVAIIADILTFDTTGDRIEAGTARVLFDRASAGEFSLGDDNGGTHLSQAELERIDAGTLVVGIGGGDSVSGFTNQINLFNVDNVNSTIGTITGQVRVRALEGTSGDVEISGANTFRSFTADVDDDITLAASATIAITGGGSAIAGLGAFDDITLGEGSSITTNGGSVSLQSNPTGPDGLISVDGDVTTNGGRFAALGRSFVVDDDGDTVSTAGGKLEVQTNEIDIDASNPTVAALDAGSGDIYFYRMTAGSVGLGQAAGQFQLNQAELDQIQADTLTIGDPDNGIAGDDLTGHVNQINAMALDDVDFSDNGAADQGIVTLVRLFALNGNADVTFDGNNIVPQIRTEAADQVVVNAPGNAAAALLSELGTIHLLASNSGGVAPGIDIAGLISSATNLQGDAFEIDLSANLVAASGIGGSAFVVNVSNPTAGAQINDALGLVTDSATTGFRAAVNVGDGTWNEAVVVTKDFVTLTGGVGAIVAPASPGFTINANGVTIDGFTYSGTGGDPAVLVTGAANNVIIKNGSITGTTVTGAGIRVDNTVTAAIVIAIDNVAMSGVAGHGIVFDGALTGADVDILNSDIRGARDGVFFAGAIAGASDILISTNDIEYGALAGDRGIEASAGVAGTAKLRIASNTIDPDASSTGDDAILVNSGIGGSAAVEIVSNFIGLGAGFIGVVPDEVGAAIDVQGGVSGTATLLISGNSMEGNQDAIQVDGTVSTTATGLSGGYGVLITGNTMQGLNRHVVEFTGAITGARIGINDNPLFNISSNPASGFGIDAIHFAGALTAGARVDILRNAQINAADSGIFFGAALNGATVNIDDNIIRANLDADAIGAGILFIGTVDGSTIRIGDIADTPGALSNIIAVSANAGGADDDQDGVRFASAVSAGSSIRINGNHIGFTATALAGPFTSAPVGGDGVDFAAIGGGTIANIGQTAANTIRSNGDGIKVTGIVDGVATRVAIENNSITTGAAAGSQGVVFESALEDSANISVEDNVIDAQDHAVAFLGAITGDLNALLVRVDGNTLTSRAADGVRFGGAIGTTVNGFTFIDIEDNDVTSALEGAHFAGTIGGTTKLDIVGNNAGFVSGRHGIFFGAAIAGAGGDPKVTIDDNIVRANTDGDAVGAGILFAGTIDGGTIRIGDAADTPGALSNIIAVDSNAGGAADNQDAIRFDAAVSSGTSLRINGNQIGFTAPALAGPLTPAPIAGDGIQFGAIGGGSIVNIGQTAGNTIDVLGDGIKVTGIVNGVATRVAIENNSITTAALATSRGVVFESALLDSANISVNDNVIDAENHAVAFLGAITGDANILLVRVDGNTITSRARDGLHFGGAIAGFTFIDVVRNLSIVGLRDGVRFESGIGGTTRLTIDGNGRATLAGLPYDGTAAVSLDDFAAVSAIVGTVGSGIGFAGIGADAAVTISRNIVSQSGNGISFADIQTTATTGIHNNVILASLADAVALAGIVTGQVEVFQNFLADSGGDGVGIAAPADVGVGNLHVRLNFMPGATFDHGNLGFGFNNDGAGVADIGFNWWGSALALFVPTAIDGQPVPAVVLFKGVDNNIVPVAALADTTFDPFAFQQDIFGAPILPSDYDQNDLEFQAPGLGSGSPTGPGQAQYNTQNNPLLIGSPVEPNAANFIYSLGATAGAGPAAGEEGAQPQCIDEFLASQNYGNTGACLQ